MCVIKSLNEGHFPGAGLGGGRGQGMTLETVLECESGKMCVTENLSLGATEWFSGSKT